MVRCQTRKEHIGLNKCINQNLLVQIKGRQAGIYGFWFIKNYGCEHGKIFELTSGNLTAFVF